MHIRDNLKAVQVGTALPVYITCRLLLLVLRCCLKHFRIWLHTHTRAHTCTHTHVHTHRRSQSVRSTCWSKLSSTGGPGYAQNLSRHSHDLSPSASEGRTSKLRTTGRSSTTSQLCHWNSLLFTSITSLHDVTWCHMMSCDVMWCHVVSHDVMWCHMMSCVVMWCHVVSHDVILSHDVVVLCSMMSCVVMDVMLFHDVM